MIYKNIVSQYRDDIIYEDIATGDRETGRKNVSAFVDNFLKGTPDVVIKPTSIVLEENLASVEWVMSAGTGANAWSTRGVAIIEYKDGLMYRVTDYWNN